MDTMLIAVTGVSLALAAAMGGLLARMVREDRRRADARVQLLEELAAGHGGGLQDVPMGPVIERPAVDLPLRPVVTEHALFHEEPEPSPWPRRFAVIGSLAAVLALSIFGWNQLRVTAPQSATVAAAPASLELLSLRHAREGNTLTVTGLVQNPKGAASLANVQATVFVFGPGGTFITSARAPLDFTSLAPGDESPFVVTVPVSGQVSRYRVGFRGPDDHVVGHVDRRTDQVGRNF